VGCLVLAELCDSTRMLLPPFLFLLPLVCDESNFLPEASFLLTSSSSSALMLTGFGTSVTGSSCFSSGCVGVPVVVLDASVSCAIWAGDEDSVNRDDDIVDVSV